MKWLWGSILIGMLLLFVACSPRAVDYEQVSEDEKIVIRFSHVVGEDTPKGQAARLFAKMVEEKTDGKVEVQVFANGSLYKDPEELQALRDGNIHMIAPSLSKLTPIVPELGVFDLPFLYPSIKEYHLAFDGILGKMITDKMKRQGLVPMAFWDNGFKQFTNNTKPIVTPEDLQGIKVRIMPSSVLDQQFALLQAQPIEMSFNDVYSALEQGSVDGQENTISNIYTKKFHKVQKYMTISDHGYLSYMVLMDQAFWSQLPSYVQNAIVEAMDEVTAWQRDAAEKINREQFMLIEKCECIEIYRLNDEQKESWKDFFRPLYMQIEGNMDKDFIRKWKQTTNF